MTTRQLERNRTNERMLRVSEVADMLSVSTATIWNWVSKDRHSNPNFPIPRKLTSKVTVWKLSEINAYLDKYIFTD